jgi:hypothetical protein
VRVVSGVEPMPALLKRPAGQSSHSTAAVELFVPAKHSMHSVDASPANLPGVHCVRAQKNGS